MMTEPFKNSPRPYTYFYWYKPLSYLPKLEFIIDLFHIIGRTTNDLSPEYITDMITTMTSITTFHGDILRMKAKTFQSETIKIFEEFFKVLVLNYRNLRASSTPQNKWKMPWMTPKEARNMLTLVNTITPGGEPSSTFKIKDWAEILPILTDEGLLKTASYGKIKDFIKRTDLLEGNIEYLFKRLIDANPDLRERISQFSKFNVGGINTEKCQEWRKETLTKKINKDENGDGEKNWKDLPADKILYELAENIDNNKFFPQFVQELVKCAKGDPSHKDVELRASRKIAEIIGAEFVFYNERPDGKMVTGHPDLIIVKDGAIFICDYKPKDELKPNSGRMSEHFWHEIPQIAGYAITLKEQLGFTERDVPIYCVTFNQDGAYLYQPGILKKFDSFLQGELGKTEWKNRALWWQYLPDYQKYPDYRDYWKRNA